MDKYHTSGGNPFIKPEAFHLDVKIVAVDCITKLPDNFFALIKYIISMTENDYNGLTKSILPSSV